ncbi:hypothetical protein niasHT_023235 [Heterodera trifolii]|uniref:Uncharacterized protein n=1 Tax=Heterodera trifolii TaxID=157864 RepID=A0ABD2JDG4_9BILA
MLPSPTHLFVFVVFFLKISLLSARVWARSQCVLARGRVICPTDPDSHFNVQIELMDSDALPWETDDVMGSATTDLLGNFSVRGCASDFGLWNDPDPYLLITHRCPQMGHDISVVKRKHRIPIDRIYLPEEVQVETTRLDCDDNCEI